VSFGYRGRWQVRAGDGLTNGAVVIPGPFRELTVIFSDGLGWEHVSVSTPSRCPNWPEMCLIKSLFWDPDDVVIQFHPAESQYVNNHPYCLHLWRLVGREWITPPSALVGTLPAPELPRQGAILEGRAVIKVSQ
jgi:hypothetical protein